MKVNGRLTSHMAGASRLQKMVQFTKESSKMEQNMAMVSINGLIIPITKDFGLTTYLMEWESSNGTMAENIMAIGKET